MPRNRIVTAVGVAVLLIMGVWIVQGAYADTVRGAGESHEVVNETFTSTSAGTLVTLSESNRSDVVYDDDDMVVVRDENDTTMDEGDDYEWNAENGTLTILGGGELVGDANGTVTYNYYEPTAEQSLVKSIALIPFQHADSILILLFAGVVFTALLMAARRT